MQINTLESLREQIQEDIRCIMDGDSDELIDSLCECVVDRFKPVIDKLIEDGKCFKSNNG